MSKKYANVFKCQQEKFVNVRECPRKKVRECPRKKSADVRGKSPRMSAGKVRECPRKKSANVRECPRKSPRMSTEKSKNVHATVCGEKSGNVRECPREKSAATVRERPQEIVRECPRRTVRRRHSRTESTNVRESPLTSAWETFFRGHTRTYADIH